MLVWESFLLAFSALFPLINPLGSALVFLGLVGDAPPEVYRSLARRIAVNNIIFLAVVELLGSAILNFFGISLPIVQLSGGIVIASIGWSVLKEPDADASMQDKREESGVRAEFNSSALEQKAFYPFTFPVTSGPGTLVVMLTLTARIDNRTPDQQSPGPSRHLSGRRLPQWDGLLLLRLCPHRYEQDLAGDGSWHPPGYRLHPALYRSSDWLERSFDPPRDPVETLIPTVCSPLGNGVLLTKCA